MTDMKWTIMKGAKGRSSSCERNRWPFFTILWEEQVAFLYHLVRGTSGLSSPSCERNKWPFFTILREGQVAFLHHLIHYERNKWPFFTSHSPWEDQVAFLHHLERGTSGLSSHLTYYERNKWPFYTSLNYERRTSGLSSPSCERDKWPFFTSHLLWE